MHSPWRGFGGTGMLVNSFISRTLHVGSKGKWTLQRRHTFPHKPLWPGRQEATSTATTQELLSCPRALSVHLSQRTGWCFPPSLENTACSDSISVLQAPASNSTSQRGHPPCTPTALTYKLSIMGVDVQGLCTLEYRGMNFMRWYIGGQATRACSV